MKTILHLIPKRLMVATFAVLGFTILTLSQAQAAANDAQALQLRLGNGRVVYFEYLKPTKKGATTFLLMPGMNRSLLISEAGPQALAKKGYGIAAMNFSVQPFSVNLLEKNETPFFMKQSPSLQDLALEVDELGKVLKEQYQADTVIPVSLSYSGAVSPFLKSFPVVIDAVPLTSGPAQNAQLEQYRQSLKMGEMWNPIFGPGITRTLLDQAYRKKWADQVTSIAKQFGFSEQRYDQMVEGYTVLSRATEGYEWNVQALAKDVHRVFVFAADEDKGLFAHQVKTFLQIYKQDEKSLLFLVKDSGHLIPGDQPEAFANILEMIEQGKTTTLNGVIEVDPTNRKTRNLRGAEATSYLQDLVNKKN